MSSTDKIVADLMNKDLTLARDYAGIINWSIPMIEKWTDDWTDYTITDPGILFLNADAFQYDMIHYSLDKAYLDNILRFTTSIRSLYFMASLVGVDLPVYKAATATLMIANHSTEYVSLPEGLQLYLKDKASKEELWYNLKAPLRIYPMSSGEVEATEGKLKTFVTTFSAFDKHQMFHIPLRNIAPNTCRLWYKVLGGYVEVSRVEDALLSTSIKPTFSVHRSYNATSFKLSPGTKKYLGGDAEVIIRYGTSTGVKGNVGTVYISSKDRILSEDGKDITDFVEFKIYYGDGGESPLTMEDERIYVGDNSWRLNTLIAPLDFETLALNNFNGDIIRFVYIQQQGKEEALLYFLPKADLRPQRLEILRAEITEKASALLFGFTTVKVREVDYYPMFFELTLTLSTNISNLQLISDEVDKIFEEYLNRETQPEEMLVKRSEFLDRIESLHEVEFATCISPIADMKASRTEVFVYAGCNIKYIQGGD